MWVWGTEGMTEVRYFTGHNSAIQAFKTLDSARCVSCDFGHVLEWSLRDFTVIRSFQIEGWSFEWQKDEMLIGTATGLSMLNLKSFQITTAVNTQSRVSFVHYDKGKCACVIGRAVEFIAVEQYPQMCELSAQECAVAGVLPCGVDRLVSWSDDKTLRVLSVDKQCELGALSGHSGTVNCAARTSDDKCISGSNDSYLKVWDLSTMNEVPTDMKHLKPVSCVAVTPSGKAVSGDIEGGVYVWSLRDYTKIGELRGHNACVFCVAVTSDELAVTGSWDCTVRVWNLVDCSQRALLKGHKEKIWSIALATGNRCISASADTTLKVWDLAEGSSIVSFNEHAGEVLTVAVAGEKCVSGSTDKAIILWDLGLKRQEARFLCSSEVLKVVFVSESRFISGHRRGEVKVWENCREIATFQGHTKRVWTLCCVDNWELVTASHDGSVKLWNLGQLSNCLSRCANYRALQSDITAMKPVETQLRQQIPDLKSGNYVPLHKDFRPYFFNSLHFCAYYNHPGLIKDYLSKGVPLLRGVLGSPLTIALERKTIKCADAVLEHLVSVAAGSAAWKSFEAVNDDLLPLIESGSSALEAFFASVLQPPPQSLPAFITPVVSLPLVQFADHHSIREYEFFNPDPQGTDLVKFCVSLLQLDFAAGSTESVNLLTAAVNCGNKRVLLTDYFRTVIEDKWARYFPFTLGVAGIYAAMLGCLLGVINWESRELCISYLALNCVLALYELAQIVAMRLGYITDGWNVVDCVRSSLSFVWSVLILKGYAIERYFTMLVVVLDFIRGFTHFRAFHTTRVFVHLTFSVVAEVYSFLVILAYSVFAFGIFASVLAGEKSLAETWKKAYNTTMGNFDTEHYGSLEWVVFTGATVTNIVVMMNLLISILGEAYEKAQMTVLESDLHMQANLVLEYETLMVWWRNSGSRTWVVTCCKADKGAEQMEWSGKVLQITNSLRSELARAQDEIIANVEGLRGQVAGEGSIQEIKAKVQKIEGIGKQVDKLEDIEARLEGLEEIKTGVENIIQFSERFEEIDKFQLMTLKAMKTQMSTVTDLQKQIESIGELQLYSVDAVKAQAESTEDFKGRLASVSGAIEGERGRVAGQVAEVKGKVEAIEERVARIEGKVAAMDGKLDAVLGFLKVGS